MSQCEKDGGLSDPARSPARAGGGGAILDDRLQRAADALKVQHPGLIKADKKNNNGNMGEATKIAAAADEESGAPSEDEEASSSSSSSSSAGVAGAAPVSVDDFEILTVLGKGAYGKVFQVKKTTGRNSGVVFALKSVSKPRICQSRTDVRHTRTERDVLVRIKHPFLVRIHYAFETLHRLYFVQEFMRGGELFRLMETEKLLIEPEARFYLAEIALALEYLHSLNIVYRDLKTENVMLDGEGHIKLIDFGLSKILNSEDDTTHTFCGTVEYMAPEVVQRSPKGHGLAADWWSFGIFAFDLLTGRSPFHSSKGKKETKERILRGKFSLPAFVTIEAGDMIRRLLRRPVDKRLGGGPAGAADVKRHPFFAKTDWGKVERREYQPPNVPEFKNVLDPADISQFDPRFTSRSPRETQCKGVLKGAEEGECCQYAKLFGDFDYVADFDDDADAENANAEDDSDDSDSSTSEDSGLKADSDDESEGETDALSAGLSEIHVRDRGE